jgi:hypothetical protein
MSDPLIVQARSILDQIDQKIAALSAPPPLVLAELQTFPWEDLWIVGRSRKWPENSPHGTASTSGVHPAVTDFRPIPVQNDRDNLYRVLRLADRIPPAMLPAITRVTYSFLLSLSSPASVQAFEFEAQRQVGLTIWNMAWQLLPAAPNHWTLRAFDYAHSTWRDTGAGFDPAILVSGAQIPVSAEFTLTASTAIHEAISINGTRTRIGLEQAAAGATSREDYFNIAVQADANAAAAPWRFSLDSVSVTLG